MLFFVSSIMLKKMVLVLVVFFLVGLTDAGQERVKVLNLVTNPTPMVLQSYSHSASNVAVSVDYQHLDGISSSVVMAESWLKTNVLTHYPAVQITTIVVGNSVLCNNTHEEQWDLVLPSMKNIYYSIVRWGLEKDIKVSAYLSTECLHPFSYTYREGLVDRVIKPLLEFLQNTANSSVTLSVPSYYLPLVTAHRESITKLGNFLESNEINVVLSSSSEERKPKSRKLSFLSSSKVVVVDPFPARPTPLPKMPSSPLHSSIGFSIPAQISKVPLPPLVQTPPAPLISDPYAPQSSTFPPLAQTSPPSPIPFPFAPQTAQPPSMYFSFGPESPPPLGIPSNPPDVEPYNPCYAPPTTTPVAPTPKPGHGNKGMWCVAKPSVPAEKLKEALDYACGVGGADCGEIKPQGSCYYPDTMVAHASYAFNSYWQKNKNKGGTCNFGGTAMVINANPSYQQCRFIIS